MITARIQPPAERFIAQCKPEHRREVIRLIASLCNDPSIDGMGKIPFEAPPLVLRLYLDNKYWIVYYLPDDRTLHVLNIGRAYLEAPNIRRR